MSEGTLKAELAAMEAYALEVTKALTGLSGGGSEMFSGKIGSIFKADIEKCVQVVRDRHDRTHQFMVNAVKEKNEAVKQSDEMAKALELVIEYDAILQRYEGNNLFLFGDDLAEIDIAYDKMISSCRSSFRHMEGDGNATL